MDFSAGANAVDLLGGSAAPAGIKRYAHHLINIF